MPREQAHEEHEFVTVLMNSKDFHTATEDEFLGSLDDHELGFLEIDEASIAEHIVATHATAEEAKAHFTSFLEVSLDFVLWICLPRFYTCPTIRNCD